ncbi:MAG TPA: hypothetical protein VGH33_24210 [Isosphaeraceae bacterium]|jgi:hypothetical protein
MDDGWIGRARRRLLALADGGCWGYRHGAPTSPEATALAALGLLATAGDPDLRTFASGAGDGLARLQRRDGSLGVVATMTMPGWATSFALLLWQAVGGFDDERRRAAAWLLGERVATTPRAAEPDRITGHDPSVPGWPWVEDTHPWVEPTAMALLALAREGFIGHPRVSDGERLLRDREIATGGWNYGNTAVFGRALRPQPAPTGLSLLALAACGGKRREVGTSLDYLRGSLPTVRAAISLGWGVLGLRAWGCSPAQAEEWLSESAEAVLGREDAAPRLGLLLIASAASGVGLLVPRSPG